VDACRGQGVVHEDSGIRINHVLHQSLIAFGADNAIGFEGRIIGFGIFNPQVNHIEVTLVTSDLYDVVIWWRIFVHNFMIRLSLCPKLIITSSDDQK